MSFRDNLIELAAAETQQIYDLLPNLWGTRIYAKGLEKKIWGYVFRWLRFLGFGHLEKSSLWSAMRKTHQAYHETLAKMETDATAYENSLRKNFNEKGASDVVMEDRKTAASRRHRLMEWFQVSSIWNASKENVAFSPLREHLVLGVKKRASTYYPLEEGACTSKLRQVKPILLLESTVHKLPLRVFSKAARQMKLSKEEDKKLEKFVSIVNKNSAVIGIRVFHKALRNLLHIEPNDEEGERSKGEIAQDKANQVINLEAALTDLDCAIFLEKDQKMIEFRKNLNEGSSVTINGEEYYLSKRLGKKTEEEDSNFTFTVKKDKKSPQESDEFVISIAENSVLPHLRRRYIAEVSSGIPPVECLEIDTKTGIAKFERLFDPLSGFRWCSTKLPVEKSDEPFLGMICELVNTLIDQNRMLTNLSAHNLLFDSKKTMKSLKLMTSDQFDFVMLANFIKQCTEEAPFVVAHIVKRSKLEMHPANLYFKRLLHSQSEEVSETAMTIAKEFKLSNNEQLVQRGREFIAELSDLRLSCLQKIGSKYDLSRAIRAAPHVIACLEESYLQFSGMGILSEYLVNATVSLMEKKHSVLFS